MNTPPSPATSTGDQGTAKAEVGIAVAADLRELEALRRDEQEAVGFLPLSRYEAEVVAGRKTLITLRDNGDMTGFLFWTRGRPVATIQQIVVRPDARRHERATALVNEACRIMEAGGHAGVTCRCRVDLEAIAFWEAMGFEMIRLEESGRRGPLMRFYLSLQPSLLSPSEFLRSSAFGPLAQQRRGFRLMSPRTASAGDQQRVSPPGETDGDRSSALAGAGGGLEEVPALADYQRLQDSSPAPLLKGEGGVAPRIGRSGEFSAPPSPFSLAQGERGELTP